MMTLVLFVHSSFLGDIFTNYISHTHVIPKHQRASYNKGTCFAGERDKVQGQNYISKPTCQSRKAQIQMRFFPDLVVVLGLRKL
jgi:hypothetical protein